MHDLPDFDTIVHYVKQGLRRKTPLDQIKAVLSRNKIASSTINKAVVVAIDQLDDERKENKQEERPKVISVTTEQYEKNQPDEKKHIAAIVIIFIMFVIGTVIFGSTQLTRLQTNDGIDSQLANIGLAFRSLFSNREYINYCQERLEVLKLTKVDLFDLCSVGAKNYEDFEIFKSGKNKDAVARIIERVQQQCHDLGPELSEPCAQNNPELMESLFNDKISSRKTLLDTMER
jgi:hypothetical protein